MLTYNEWFEEKGMKKRNKILKYFSKTPQILNNEIKSKLMNNVSTEDYINSLLEKMYGEYLDKHIDKISKRSVLVSNDKNVNELLNTIIPMATNVESNTDDVDEELDSKEMPLIRIMINNICKDDKSIREFYSNVVEPSGIVNCVDISKNKVYVSRNDAITCIRNYLEDIEYNELLNICLERNIIVSNKILITMLVQELSGCNEGELIPTTKDVLKYIANMIALSNNTSDLVTLLSRYSNDDELLYACFR